ncbi:hypothetical protein RclHR1_03760013 [Rhizophagus clarus]|uniref:Uncharacterized protein n=1 Tax=Rhizophagus clarus TaxID=94130 RepID=A0A2Z6S7G1_9GLOM|nr:hypothetical protein RclHR1_03760013 [Rhizophagus clarus]GES79950.1 hypothetical protein GLOIN_2v1472969 [Rhizophagus clarus]
MHLPAEVQSALGSIDDLNKLKQLPQEKEISDLVRELVRRNGRITGKDIMEFNVKKEVEIKQSYYVPCLTEVIWDTRLTTRERKCFDKFANEISKINNEDTLHRIAQINVPQDMHLPPNIPGGFYRGYKIFDDDDVNPERLILASIFSGPSGFQWP